jgi:hypothetical protein
VTPVQTRQDEVLALVSDAARRLHDRHDDIAAQMSRLLARHMEALAADAALGELMEASVDANVRTAVHVLTNHIPIEHLQPTTAAVEYALRLAQRDVPGSSLVRAYHMGQEYLVECAFAEVEQLDSPDDLKLDVMRHISRVVYQYIDWISLYVLGTYEAERQRWASSRGNVQSSLIHQVLAGADVAPSTFESETGYRLDQHHVGAVVWTTDPAAAHPDRGGPGHGLGLAPLRTPPAGRRHRRRPGLHRLGRHLRRGAGDAGAGNRRLHPYPRPGPGGPGRGPRGGRRGPGGGELR